MRKITVQVKPTSYRRKGTLIRRKGYSYRRRDIGKPGKGPKLITVKPGKLHPYSTAQKESTRRRTLDKKVRRYGPTSVFRSLNAQVIFRKRQPDHAKQTFIADRSYIKEKYMEK